MIRAFTDVYGHRELVGTLAWRGITVRYKQAYLGIAWAVLKPLTLVLIFTIVRSFVGISSGNIPYPILTFAALMPWILFQESTSESVNSITANAALIRKIYFPREILPLTALVTKLFELVINFVILAGLMAYYQMAPTLQILWVPLIILYTLLAALTVGLVGAALNVYYRDVSAALPVGINLLMYLSPVIYPLSLVQQRLLEQRAAGEWSEWLYFLYTANPLAGIIDAFQRVVLKGMPPDPQVLWPGLLLTLLLLPLSYRYFKRAESYFADVI
jgi:lipopolysaccharide transport system permease protein